MIWNRHKEAKRIGIAIRAMLILMLLCFSNPLKAQSSSVRYVDDEAGFVVLDQVSPDIKDGDKVCVFEPGKTSPTCDVNFRWHQRNALLYPPKEFLERWEVGTNLDVKKIMFEGKDKTELSDVASFNKDYLDSREKEAKVEKTKAIVSQNKLPKGAPPEVAVEGAVIEGDDFPEIYIPKLRKAKKKSKRDLSEAAMTAKAIKKALKDRGVASYSFVSDPEPADMTPLPVREDYPNPLHGSLEVSAMQSMPILAMAQYNSLGFRTITNSTVNRDSLWKGSRTKLSATSGAGLEMVVMSKMSSFFNFGWRYHTFNSLKSVATFDEFDTSLLAHSSTRVNEQVVNADWGKRQQWTDFFFTSYSLGLDLAYTDVNFQSHVPGNAISAPMVIAFARHNFLTAAPRTQLRIGVQRWGFAMSLGALFIVPVYDFRDKFTGEVAVPDRITFQGNPNDDLKNSLAQKRNPVSIEAFLSISYQPQRK